MKDFAESNLSLRERKVLKELDVNARQGISSIGSKLKISKQAVNYHIEKMIRKGFIKEFITYFDTNKLGYTFYNIVIKLKYTTKEDRKKIVDKLKGISNVVWVASFRGEYQMIVSILAKDVGEFSFYLEEVLHSLKGKLLDYNFFIVISASQLGYKKIHSGTKSKYNYDAMIGHKDLARLSGNDLKVLKIIANNAKMSIVDIAKRTGLTIEKARYSLKKMEKEKIIQGYKPLVDVAKWGYLWHVMFLRLKSSSAAEKEKMISFLKSFPEVFYVVRGVGNCNLMVEFQTKTLDEFERVKDKVSNEFSGLIADEKTVQLIEEHKCTYFPGSLG
ncbi:Lrp/AsnC family transcriptional regulator [archaeon]|nr:Lrp/AsnC family transcriptional regulator [archaeon]